MGQKVNPTGFRLGVSKKQNANWYAKGKDFSKYLIATSEQTICAKLCGMKMNHNNLPIKILSFSNCFHTETGSHGKDTKGLFR